MRSAAMILRFLCLPLLLLLQSRPSTCFPGSSLNLFELDKRATVIPAPISVSPAQQFEGIDGSWNTFALRIGTPAQVVRVILSTASQQVWAVDPRGCPDDSASNTTCADSRGKTYSYETSTTWSMVGLYDLWVEGNLGLTGNAEYGYDTVGLGYPGEGGVTLNKQTVGAMAAPDFNFGHFGIDPKSTNFTNFTTEAPSFMTSLRTQNLIPSVSWGYTAGAPYRFAKILASLTLGGYDSSRFIPNGVVFPFAPDNERDILVSVTGINAVDSSGVQNSLLPKSVYSYIDSTVAEIWLPVESCVLFEKAFGLTYDTESELYLVPDNVHNALLVSNPNITITVAPYTQAPGASASVDITLPYSAFDQTAKPPYQNINATSRYFPLRRALNETAYTLGRTFLQEAFLTVDWERQNFSVAQCLWVSGAPAHIVAISSYNSTSNGNGTEGATGGASKMSPLGTGAIAGIAVGAVAIVLFSALIVLLYLRNQHKKNKAKEQTLPPKTVDTETSHDSEDPNTIVFQKAELDASSPSRYDVNEFYKPGLSGSMSSSQAALVHELDVKEREVYEMEGDAPKRQEADGHQFTEKEAIRHREERINGTDISPITPVSSERSPTSTEGTNTIPSSLGVSTLGARSRNLVTPGDVIELTPVENRTMQLVSPLDGSDGSRTMNFNFNTMGPLSPVNDPESATRKRFSYEDP